MSKGGGWDWTPGEVRFIIGGSAIDVYVYVKTSGSAPVSAEGWHYKAFPRGLGMIGVLDKMRRREVNPVLWQQEKPK